MTDPTRTFLALALGVSLVGSATSSASDTAIDVSTSVNEKHYDVRGRDPAEVFASIQTRGLGSRAGLAASGLTESDLSYSISTLKQDGGCHLDAVEFKMDITVTLPRHAAPSTLDSSNRRHWEAYEAQVEYHEYRHVEIEFQGLQELKDDLARTLAKPSQEPSRDCGKVVQDAVDRQLKITRERHAKFHVEESREVRRAQDALLSEISDLDTQLMDQRAELKRLSIELKTNRAQRARWVQELEALIDRWGPELPRPAFARAEELSAATEELSAYSAEVRALHDTLVSRHNELVKRRRSIVRQLAWTR